MNQSPVVAEPLLVGNFAALAHFGQVGQGFEQSHSKGFPVHILHFVGEKLRIRTSNAAVVGIETEKVLSESERRRSRGSLGRMRRMHRTEDMEN